MDGIIIEFFATFLIWILYAGLIVLWFVNGKIKKEQVAYALAAGLTAWIIAQVIKLVFPTLRPFAVDGGEIGVLITPVGSAFPSAHTAMAFSLAVTIFLHDGKVGWFYLIGALVVGVARVVANVHYPVDILGGALIGTFVAIVIEKTHMFRFLERTKHKK